MTSESVTETEAQAQSPFDDLQAKTFEEKAALLSEDVKTKINHTLSFMEAGMNQWEQVKEKGHTPESFITGFIHVLKEYDGLRSSGTDLRRAQMLTLMKMRTAFVEIAFEDFLKSTAN